MEVVRGASPRPKGDPRYFGGNIPWISIRDVNAEKGVFLSKTVEGVTQAGAEKSRIVEAGDLILSNSGSVCIPKILKYKGCIHDGFVTFPDLNKYFSVLYFYYLFEWMRPAVIQANRQGVTQVNLNTGIVKAFQIPVPSLAEQEEVASRLDDLLTRIDRLKTRLDAIPQILKRFRQSVLAAAVSGRLTEGWREEHGMKQEDFWRFETIADLGKILTGNTPSKKRPHYYGGDFPMFKPSDLDAGYHVIKGSEYLSESGREQSRFIPAGSTLVTCIGTIGKTGFLRVDGTCNQQINAIIPSENILKYWVYFLIRSPQIQEVLIANSSSTTLSILNKSRFSMIQIKIPPYEEQLKIVSRVEQLFAFADQIENRVKEARAKAEHMTPSVLARAFRGELTADWREQHPELISGENSAKVLLEKIRTQKENLKPARKPRTRKKKVHPCPWSQMSEEEKNYILSKVWCTRCRRLVELQLLDGRMEERSFILTGTCKTCGHKAVRVLEPE
ncbi:type I restriction enzyme S subunit [Desulfobotulus alkaliphilus]|uniref:Type I restriction enzyme S subunit n=1 Tax=Desulfobotulus alkaliphilus TaxID=622671 RepID=A0A562S7S3_9BACT|nr:type I restriction enzyme S subunit [Desulfobotulus alkaliphilus]